MPGAYSTGKRRLLSLQPNLCCAREKGWHLQKTREGVIQYVTWMVGAQAPSWNFEQVSSLVQLGLHTYTMEKLTNGSGPLRGNSQAVWRVLEEEAALFIRATVWRVLPGVKHHHSIVPSLNILELDWGLLSPTASFYAPNWRSFRDRECNL